VARDIVPRARLLARLNAELPRTLTLISAAAGYGKSTLASRWAEASAVHSGWVSLDERDSDPREFLRYLLAAIRSRFPAAELRTETLLEAHQMAPAEECARYLLNDLNSLPEPFLLFLDDYHHIQGSFVHDLLAAILEHPPQTLHLVVLTRRDPPLPIARLRGRGQAVEVRAADLRFTAAEAAAFLTNVARFPVDDSMATVLAEKTEGWVTGLRLAGLLLRGHDDPEGLVRELRGSSRHVAEYLASEVLSAQEPEIASHLLEASILDRFCAPLCQALHDQAGEGADGGERLAARRFIERLTAANLFTIPLDAEGHWHRYHHLFREFLQSELRKRANAEAIAGLHRKASAWFAQNGLLEEAIQHALAAGDVAAAIRLVVTHRYDLMNATQFHRLRRWLEWLPSEVTAGTPLLATTQALLGIEQGRDADVFAYTQRASQMLSGLSAESAEYGVLKSEVSVLQGVIDVALGRPESGLTHAKQALDALPAQASLFRSLALFVRVACLQMEGRLGEAVKAAGGALEGEGWSVKLRARLHHYLAIVHLLDADLDGALAASRNCLQILHGRSFVHNETFSKYLTGAAHYCRNEMTEAELFLRSVVKDCREATPSYAANAGFVLACICLASSSEEEAEQILAQTEAYIQDYGHETMAKMCRAFRVEFSIRRGDIETSRRLAKGLSFDIRPPLWFFYVPQLTPIKLLLADGTDQSLKEAHTRLAEFDEQMGRIQRKNVRIDILALLALVRHKQGEEAAALGHLQAALALAEPGRWVRNFVDLGSPMRVLLERLARTHSDESGYARRVLEAWEASGRGGASPVPGPATETTCPAQADAPVLSPREIQILSLVAEGLANREIAQTLHLATDTVKTHLQNMYKKLDRKGRIAAVNAARDAGLLTSHRVVERG